MKFNNRPFITVLVTPEGFKVIEHNFKNSDKYSFSDDEKVLSYLTMNFVKYNKLDVVLQIPDKNTSELFKNHLITGAPFSEERIFISESDWTEHHSKAKILKFKATKIFGLWNLSIPIGPTITILCGLNGSGKSTIMELLNSRINKLDSSKFGTSCEVKIQNNGSLKHPLVSNFIDSQDNKQLYLNIKKIAVLKKQGHDIKPLLDALIPLATTFDFLGHEDSYKDSYLRTLTLSAGLKKMVLLTTTVFLSEANLFFIDELESSVHSDLQILLLKALISLAPDSQFIISTHSQEILKSAEWLDHIVNVDQVRTHTLL
jgi:predicted ATPase